VIVSDFSAQPELIGPHSKAVPVQRVWDEFQTSFFGIPNVPAIVTALQEVYEEAKGGRVDRGAVSAAMERYDQVKVYAADWKPLIELMTARNVAHPSPSSDAVSVPAGSSSMQRMWTGVHADRSSAD
jgi:hypothetical protein